MTNLQAKYRIQGFYVSLLLILTVLWLCPYSQAASREMDDHTAIQRLSVEKLPVFEDDMALARLAAGIESSIAYYGKLPASREFSLGGDSYSAGQYKDRLAQFLSFIRESPSPDDVSEWVARHFRVYAVTQLGEPGGVLYTGYYMPVLNGSRNKTGKYRYPVYNRPSDLVTFSPADFCDTCPQARLVGRYAGSEVLPYYTRQTIERSRILEKTASPIVWVDDPVDLFFLHVQGSGLVRLPGGELINVHYAVTNGHPYKSIGNYLIRNGEIAQKDLTMQSIRRYLKNHPDKRDSVFAYNPRYVFFKEEPGGPTGCLGVEITPGRSIAMDQGVYPPGALAFIQSEKPVLDKSGRVEKWERFSRFALNQDTGDAIRGIDRVDIFWGGGRYAEAAAGRMKHPGKLFILMPR